MRRAIFPGTFDPFTIGHSSVVSRALTFIDEIVIGIGINEDMRSTKKSGSRHYTGREATLCAISHLEKIANDLKYHLDHDECGTCCDQKH